MFSLVLAAMAFVIPSPGSDQGDLLPGDGVALDPVAPVVMPVDLPRTPGPSTDSTVPLGFGALGAISVLGLGLAAERRRRRSMEPLFVVVHGNGGSAEDFDPLLEQLSVGSFSVVAFDWRSVSAGATSTDASEVASTEMAALELDSLLRDLSKDNGNIYTLHHSKGGAVGVSMIAALDDGTRPMIDGYRGAALLDPAIAGGWLGAGQRLGGISRQIPDNGGFDPIACTSQGCRDRREYLGEASGVEVIAIRNPDALVTNFLDRPDGLRVFDLVDDGRPSAAWFWTNPWLFAGRVSEAHGSVLVNWAVADCISAEVAKPGGCVWKGDGWRP